MVGARPGRAVVVRDEEGLLSGNLTEGEPSGKGGHFAAEALSMEGGHSVAGAFSVEGGHSAAGAFSIGGGHLKEAFQAFSAYAAEKVPVGSNTRGSAAYRSHLAGVLIRRGLTALNESGKEERGMKDAD